MLWWNCSKTRKHSWGWKLFPEVKKNFCRNWKSLKVFLITLELLIDSSLFKTTLIYIYILIKWFWATSNLRNVFCYDIFMCKTINNSQHKHWLDNLFQLRCKKSYPLTLNWLGGGGWGGVVNLTHSLIISGESVKPCFFCDFYYFSSLTFPENFIEISHIVQKIWRFFTLIFTIFINFSDFLTFPCYRKTNYVNTKQMTFNNCIKFYLKMIFNLTPPPLKKNKTKKQKTKKNYP